MRTPGDNNGLCLTASPSFPIDDSAFAIRTPAGELAHLAGEVVSPSGDVDTLDGRAILGSTPPALCLEFPVGAPPSDTYVQARTRSSVPIRVAEMFWLSTSK